MDSTKPPGIGISAILLDELNLKKNKIDLDPAKQYSVNVNIGRQVSMSPDEKNGMLILKLIVTEAENLFIFEMGYRLTAFVIPGQENLSMNDFLNVNAPGALYPMIRETLLTVSQKAGIPLILPPFNFMQFSAPVSDMSTPLLQH